MKRNRVLPVVFSDAEIERIESLRLAYRSLSGCKVSKADILRYGLSLVPSQSSFFGNGGVNA